MKRTMFQLYLKNCDNALELYQNAFNAELINIYRNPKDNSIVHAELNVFGQIIALSEKNDDNHSGNTMQLCFHFGQGYEEVIKNAYEILKEDAQIGFPLGPCFYSPLMFGLIDKFGVNWCLFI